MPNTNNCNVKLMPPSLQPWQPEKEKSKQIALLVSGGVDSGVSAYLLKQAGWQVLGITMKMPIFHKTEPSEVYGKEAIAICQQLDIPHYTIDISEPFEQLIIENFRRSYAAGQTPNPCAECNKRIKFALVWDFIKENFDIDFLATGHYARISKEGNSYFLGRAKDKTKDQSYFMYGISREKLERIIFPVGGFSKKDCRSIAAKASLKVAQHAESMELCFAGGGDYRNVLPASYAEQPGDIIDMQGKKIGTHKGIANYTLGQRRGIGFAAGVPVYVAKIDPQQNTITLAAKDQISYPVVTARDVNVLIPDEFNNGRKLSGKIRSYGNPSPCKITNTADEQMTVEFDKPKFAPAPGQKLVLYNKDNNIVAGGTIT